MMYMLLCDKLHLDIENSTEWVTENRFEGILNGNKGSKTHFDFKTKDIYVFFF